MRITRTKLGTLVTFAGTTVSLAGEMKVAASNEPVEAIQWIGVTVFGLTGTLIGCLALIACKVLAPALTAHAATVVMQETASLQRKAHPRLRLLPGESGHQG